MRYFDFERLEQLAELFDRAQQTILLAIIIFLVYIWVKLFLSWDN